MSASTPHELPTALRADLADFSAGLWSGRVRLDLLPKLMGGIEDLPPNTVGWADAKIAWEAGLHGRPRKRGLRSLFKPVVSDRDLIAHHPELAPLFSFHRDGFVRQAALEAWAAPPTSAFLVAAIAWRVNDWVEPIRVAARRAAERLLPLAPAGAVAGAAPHLLDRWLAWERWDPEGAAVIDRALRRRDVVAALVERLMTSPTGPLARVLRYALKGEGFDAYLPSLATQAAQPAVRAVALQTLIERRASWPVGFKRQWIDKRFNLSRRVLQFDHRPVEIDQSPEALIFLGLHDRSAAVRRVAADVLIRQRNFISELGKFVAILTADRNPGLRQRGAFLTDELRRAN